MQSWLPEFEKGQKKLFLPLAEIVAPKAPVIPPPEVLEKIKLFDKYDKRFPVLQLRDGFRLSITSSESPFDFQMENWLNYLTLSFLQVSLAECEEAPVVKRGLVYAYRDANALNQDKLRVEVALWNQQHQGEGEELPPEDEEDPDDDGDYPEEDEPELDPIPWEPPPPDIVPEPEEPF